MTPSRFLGTTEFAPGKWVGVELESRLGKNSGVVNGKEYFKCAENFGLFLRPIQLQVQVMHSGDTVTVPSTLSRTPSCACVHVCVYM